MGFLVGWLLEHETHGNSRDHVHFTFVSYERRVEGRSLLRDIPGADVFFALEDPPTSVEPAEFDA